MPDSHLAPPENPPCPLCISEMSWCDRMETYVCLERCAASLCRGCDRVECEHYEAEEESDHESITA